MMRAGGMRMFRRLSARPSSSLTLAVAVFSVIGAVAVLGAQRGAQPAAAPPQAEAAPPTPRATAPLDLTGYWVSVVTEDWRWRMVTPPKGDYASLPLTPAARQVADTWDLAKDKANGDECKAFGAAGLLRLPMR